MIRIRMFSYQRALLRTVAPLKTLILIEEEKKTNELQKKNHFKS